MTPPVGKMQVWGSQLAARDAPLAQHLKGLFWRKGKGFINEGQKKFFHKIFSQ